MRPQRHYFNFPEKNFLSKLLFLFFLVGICISCNQITGDEPASKVYPEMITPAGKKEMILKTDRPPNFETPLKYFLLDFTPNDVFFVRWHLAGLPSQVNEDDFRLTISGYVKNQLSLSLKELKTGFKPVELNAVCACAGNSRSFLDPGVPGVQWKNGAMGNARWKGVRLKDILDKAGIKTGAFSVSFNGLDEPPLASVPDFVKSLDIAHANDGEVLVAYEMNGDPLPLLNGYPLKLIVPGWYATYWVGMLSEIKIYPDTFKGYWMEKAYLVPKNIAYGNEQPDSLAKKLNPISKMDVRSLFISPEEGSTIHAGQPCTVQGIAFDGGDGIEKVELSLDSGNTWNSCRLEPSLGKYSWRRWNYSFNPGEGSLHLQVKATNVKGETQPKHQWNRSGYMRNEIETLNLEAVN